MERRLAGVGWTSTSSELTANARSIAATVYKARLGKQAATVLAFSHYGFENDLGKPCPMTYVIAEPCIGTKDNSCVEVCPVDCIHPTPEEPGYEAAAMLYIDACVEACPVDAIFAEDQLPGEWQQFTAKNAAYYRQANS